MTAYFVFIAMHLILLLAAISTNAVSVAFNDITLSLHASLVVAGWVLSIYLLVFTISTALMGKISDMYGRKRVFMICVVVFVFGSFLAAIAPNIQVLILARLIQAVGGGGFVPATLAIITEVFPQKRHQMVAISISVFNIGGIIGPSIGAWLVTSFGWRSVFWFNVPFGILALIPVIILLKPSPRTPGKLDLFGAALLAGILSGIMIGLSNIDVKNTPIQWIIAAGFLFLGLICLWFFWQHEKKTVGPIVDLKLLKLKPFFASNIYNIIYGASVFSFSSFIPLFITSVYGLGTYYSGIVLSIRSVGNIIAALAASFMVTRWGYRKPLLVGTVLVSATILLMAAEPKALDFLGIHIGAIWILSILGFISGIAMGMIAPALINSLVDLMPEKTAAIAGLGSVFRQSGGAIFIALITVVVQALNNPAQGFMLSFAIVGILALACLPFIFTMPEHGDKLPP
jgi:MFS family permease